MHTTKLTLALIGGALLTASTLHAGGDAWLTNYKEASELAAKENKLLLMDFTGSDWCGWCIKLDKEIFSTTEFQSYAKEHLVLLKLDFPRAKPQSDEEKKQNRELAEQHGIQGYPTIVVLDAKGAKVGELGYMPGGPAAFIAELKKLKS